MLPSGEKRIGVENTGVVLGYSERFFFQRTKRQSKALKTVYAMGFSGEQVLLGIIRQGEDNRGASLANTFRLRGKGEGLKEENRCFFPFPFNL
jgi:hypothetical protein